MLNKMKLKSSNRYEFITKAGTAFHLALFNLFRTVWKSERIPDSWRETVLVQLSKSRGKTGELKNMRHIHLRNIYLSLFSQIVISFVKDSLIDHLSKYQIACKPGRRPSEHLFTIKSIIAFYQKQKKGIILSSLHISTFYDSENLTDCLSEIYKCSVKGKIYRLIFEMNKTSRLVSERQLASQTQRTYILF